MSLSTRLYHACFIICSLLLLPAAASAATQAQVFPPANCSASEQRVITWQDGTTTTYCASGQQVLDLALPDCNEGQVVTREGGKFVCKDPTAHMTCTDALLHKTYTDILSGDPRAVVEVVVDHPGGHPGAGFHGLQCAAGWQKVGSCNVSVLGTDNDVIAIENGCLVDDDEWSQLGDHEWTGLNLTCCLE